MKASARAGANIAFVKYWGNRDAALHLPLNSSISMTLDNAFTTTTVAFERGLPADRLWLNGSPADESVRARASAHLDRLRALAGRGGPARVVSENSFPTGAGIASSASGFAALTAAAAAALGLALSPAELGRLARLASGSACRSIYGGFVEWQAGADDATSVALPLAPPERWPLVDIIAIVSSGVKQVSSEEGHARAHSSPYLPARLAALPAALAQARAAIQACDLAALGEVAEAEALSLHAIAMTSRPSALYWEPATLELIRAVRAWREAGLPVYFSIDAGPNVHLLTLPEQRAAVLAQLARMPAVTQALVCGPGPGLALCTGHLF